MFTILTSVPAIRFIHHMHPVWNLLFYNPSFWMQVGKHGFSLRRVCKSFRIEIPDHLAIAAIFRAKRCRKVVLFRLLPLSVNDVIGMRSPTVFLDAFAIAVRKAGGFENCMALLRDKGWRSWCEDDAKRRVARDRVDALIKESGFNGLVNTQDPMYISATTTRRRVDRAVVWRYECTYEGLLPWEEYNPLEAGVVRARLLHSSVECRTLIRVLHDAVGFWYRGIHSDMFAIEASIRRVRERGEKLIGNALQHQLISGGVLIIGEVSFHPEIVYIGGRFPLCVMIPSFMFNDKRFTAFALSVWLVLIVIIFSSLGVLQSSFFRFGPSPSLHFMTIAIDTPEEWFMLATYCCVDTLVKTFGHDSIVPWLTHTLSDPKCRSLPYKRSVCLAVMEVYFAYVHISGMFKFFLSLTQFDFVLINMISDMSMKIYSYSSYMETKTYTPPTVASSDPDSQTLMMLPAATRKCDCASNDI